MRGIRVLALSVGACLLLSPLSVRAGDEVKKPGQPGGRPGNKGHGFLPPEVMEKLNLTGEQKEKVAQMHKDLEEKQKEAYEKAKGLKETDPDQAKEIMKGVEQMRGEMIGKFKEMLNDEQKQKLEQMRKEPGKRPGAPGKPGENTRPGAKPGEHSRLMPPFLAERLKLTPEQREKMAKLEKEMDGKLMEILTDEQKKQLEEMKKAQAGARPGVRPGIKPGDGRPMKPGEGKPGEGKPGEGGKPGTKPEPKPDTTNPFLPGK